MEDATWWALEAQAIMAHSEAIQSELEQLAVAAAAFEHREGLPSPTLRKAIGQFLGELRAFRAALATWRAAVDI